MKNRLISAAGVEVLLVDDNRMNQQLMHKKLEKLSASLDIAENIMSCFDLCRHRHYDIIFMDSLLADMDGEDILGQMRRNEDCKCAESPVVCLVGLGEKYDEEYVNDFGFSGILEEPVATEALSETLINFLPESLLTIENGSSAGLPEVEGFDFEYAVSLLGDDRDMLIQAAEGLISTAESYTDKLIELAKNINEVGVADEYRIAVHTLKSSAATLGATTLSKLSKFLELAAKEHDREKIKRLTGPYVSELKSYISRLKEILPKDDEIEEKNADWQPEMIMSMLNMMKAGLENNDYSTADLVCTELKKYYFGPDTQETVDRLIRQVENLEADEAVETIDSISL